jgi:hypothetical protein
VALAHQQSARNLGYGIGGLLAGVALFNHGRLAFDAVLWGNAASYVIAGVLVATLTDGRTGVKDTSVSGYRAVLEDRRYTGLALLNVAAALHDSMLRVAMPLWIVTRTSVPPAITGPLFALNTFLVALLQVRVTRAVTRRHDISHAYRMVAVAFGMAAGGFALAASLPVVPAAGMLAAALICLTLAEQSNTAGEAFLSVEMAPPKLQGRYISLFKTSMTVQQALGRRLSPSYSSSLAGPAGSSQSQPGEGRHPRQRRRGRNPTAPYGTPCRAACVHRTSGKPLVVGLVRGGPPFLLLGGVLLCPMQRRLDRRLESETAA